MALRDQAQGKRTLAHRHHLDLHLQILEPSSQVFIAVYVWDERQSQSQINLRGSHRHTDSTLYTIPDAPKSCGMVLPVRIREPFQRADVTTDTCRIESNTVSRLRSMFLEALCEQTGALSEICDPLSGRSTLHAGTG